MLHHAAISHAAFVPPHRVAVYRDHWTGIVNVGLGIQATLSMDSGFAHGGGRYTNINAIPVRLAGPKEFVDHFGRLQADAYSTGELTTRHLTCQTPKRDWKRAWGMGLRGLPHGADAGKMAL